MTSESSNIDIATSYANKNGLQQEAESLSAQRLDAAQNPDIQRALASERQSQESACRFANSVRDDVKKRYPNDADRFTPEDLFKGLDQLKRGKTVSPELRQSLAMNGLGSQSVDEVQNKLLDKIIAEQDCAQSLQVAHQINQHIHGKGGRLDSLMQVIRSNGLKDLGSLIKGVGQRDLTEYMLHRRTELLQHNRLRQAQNAYTSAETIRDEAVRYLQVDRTIPTPPNSPPNPNTHSRMPNPSAKINLKTKNLSSSVGGRSGTDEDTVRSMSRESSEVGDKKLVSLCVDIGVVTDAKGNAVDFSKLDEASVKATYEGLRKLQADEKFGGVRILADGMGGTGDGESASRIGEFAAEKYILDALNRNEPVDEKMLTEAMVFANNALTQWNKMKGKGSGTTLVCTLTNTQGETICASVGDSRIYSRNTKGEMSSLFVDQSLVSQLLMAGAIKPSEVLTHPDKNIISNSLGDKSKPLTVSEIQVQKVKMAPGENLLMVCDGVWEDIDHTQNQAQLTKIDTEYAAEVARLVSSGLTEDNAKAQAYKRAAGKMMEIQVSAAERKVQADPQKYPDIAVALTKDMGKNSMDNVSAIVLVSEAAPIALNSDPMMAGVPFRIYDNTPASKPVQGMILEYDTLTSDAMVQWTDASGAVRTEKMTKSEIERRIKQDNPPPPPASLSRVESPHELDAYIEDQRIKGHVNYPMTDGTPLSANTLAERIRYLNQHVSLHDIAKNFPPCFQDAAWSIVRHQKELAKARSVI